jgi:hypothetical protein
MTLGGLTVGILVDDELDRAKSNSANIPVTGHLAPLSIKSTYRTRPRNPNADRGWYYYNNDVGTAA